MSSKSRDTGPYPLLGKQRQKEIRALQQKKYRDRFQQFVIEGIRSVQSALDAKASIDAVIVSRNGKLDAHTEKRITQQSIPLYAVSRNDLDRLSGVRTSQVVLAVVHQQSVPWETLLTMESVLVLDGVQDPGNVGTLIRTAAWFGVEGIVAGAGTADFYNPKVVRASMGGLWDIQLAQTAHVTTLLRRAHAQGRSVYGADLDGTPMRAWHPRKPSMLVMGSEAHGIQGEVRACLHEAVTIPSQAGRQGVESLNVAVAGGLLMERWLGN